MKPQSLRIAVLGTGMAALLTACGGKPQQHQMPPQPVGVITLKAQSVPLVQDVNGRLSAYRSADVRARVAGVLLKRTYDEGTDVKQGQQLFQIDPAPLKASLDAAQASLAQARASYTNAHIAAQRARRLAPKGFVSRADLDNAEASERTTAAAVQVARAKVESARIDLGYAKVTAPISGRAGKQQVTEGALVGQDSATLLTTIDQIDPLYVNFTLGVDALDGLRQAQSTGNATLLGQNKGTLRLKLPDGSTYGQTGTIDFSGTTVDPSTGAVALRAVIPNPQHALLPGMYVAARVTLGQLHHAFLVPEAAVQRDGQGAYVLTVGKDNKVAIARLTTHGEYKHDWIVTAGVQDGTRVIMSGIPKARPGLPVKVHAWQPPGHAAPAAAGTAAKAKAHAGSGKPAAHKH